MRKEWFVCFGWFYRPVSAIAQEPQTLPHGDAPLEEEGTNLIDDASALPD
jgi:hypothetical protein